MLECFKSKSGGSIYYFDGKRISKKEAQNISSGKKLPNCEIKSSKNELKSLKKRLKDVMSGRESYKSESKDLRQRLNACDIIKTKYMDLIALIESASDKVDVMNRVCLTQDVKRKMDEEYTNIEKSLQNYTLKNKELEGVIENDKSIINDLTNMLYQTKQLNLNLESVVEQERKGKLNVEKTLNDLTEQCSDRPDLLRTIETLGGQITKLQESNDTIKVDLQSTIKMNDDMKKAVSSLKTKLKMYKEEAKKVSELTNLLDQYKVAVNRYDMEIETLDRENKELRDSIVGNADLQTILDQLRFELNNRVKEEEEMRKQLIMYDKRYEEAVNKYANDMEESDNRINELENELSQIRGDCETTITKLEEKDDLSEQEINNLRISINSLNDKLEKDKENCLIEIQKAIDEQRDISKSEAREYEKRLEELNDKLKLAESMKKDILNIPIETAGQLSTLKDIKKKAKKIKNKKSNSK